jgi:hypothetical protein
MAVVACETTLLKKMKEGENQLLEALDSYIANSVSAATIDEVISNNYYTGYVASEEPVYPDISSYIDGQKNGETFSVMLNRLREERHLKPPELYKAANISRKLYSQIMGERDYKPSKNTVISFGLALKLSNHGMDALLESAGYALSRSVIFDLVIRFCVENRIYSISDVNALLLAKNEPILG